MIGDSPTKEFEAGYITCPDSVGKKKKNPKRTHTHTHRASQHQLGPGPVITSQTWRENFSECAVIDICRSVCPHQPQIKAENRRQDSTGRSRGGLRRSPFDVCESAHQCGEPASSWHGGSPRLTLSSARLIVSPSERTGLLFSEVRGRISSSKLGSCFLIGLHLSTARAATQANTPMIRREACLNSLLFLLPVRSSHRCCVFISSMCSSASCLVDRMKGGRGGAPA